MTLAEMRRNGFSPRMERAKCSEAAQIVLLIPGRRARRRQNTLDSALCEEQRSQARQPPRRRNSLRMRETILRWGRAILLAIVGACPVAVDLTKDDKLPYGPFVPIGYSRANTYPLVLRLHGGEGNDNLSQITHGKGCTCGSPAKYRPEGSGIATGATMPRARELPRLGTESANHAWRRALQMLASAEKQFAIDLDRIYVVGQSMGGLGVRSLLQTHPEKWAAAVVLAAYDNFTAPMSINQIPWWVFLQRHAGGSVPLHLVRGNDEATEEAERQPAVLGIPRRGSGCVNAGIC